MESPTVPFLQSWTRSESRGEPRITFLRDTNSRTARKFEVQGIPRMIVIGRDGKVAADHTGYGEGSIPELVDELNQLLAQKT